MLTRTEPSTRARLEAEKVPLRVARWVAGGHTREERARRADVALYARARLGCEGWPEPWLLGAFASHDAATCTARRNRGLRRLSVEETCADFTLPAAPAPRRATKRERQAAELVTLQERVALLEATVARRAR
jgi:hypothetical protein